MISCCTLSLSPACSWRGFFATSTLLKQQEGKHADHTHWELSSSRIVKGKKHHEDPCCHALQVNLSSMLADEVAALSDGLVAKPTGVTTLLLHCMPRCDACTAQVGEQCMGVGGASMCKLCMRVGVQAVHEGGGASCA
jgi:hypothetical protein